MRPMNAQQIREDKVLTARQNETLKEYNRAEARRTKRRKERVTTHPKERRAMGAEVIRMILERGRPVPLEGTLRFGSGPDMPATITGLENIPAAIEIPEGEPGAGSVGETS